MALGSSDNLALSIHKRTDGAAERLVRCYQDQLYNYAFRLLRNPMDAQEVAQDAFVQAIKALTLRYDEDRCSHLALRPWLFRITRNLAYNRCRKRARIKEEPLGIGSNGDSPVLARAVHPRPGLPFSRENEALDDALERLGPESRELVVLRFIEEMSYADIAAIAGTSEAAVRGKVFRALGKLRAFLSRMERRDAM